MEQQNSSDWYDTAEHGASWYQPSAAETAAPQQAHSRPKRTGFKVTMIVLCVLILIAATAFAFGGRSAPEEDPAVPEVPSNRDPYGFSLPDYGDGSGFAEDFRDFFRDYYTDVDTDEACRAPRAPLLEDVEIGLASPEGKELLTLQQLYERCLDSVVGITATADGAYGYYWGTGIIISSDGYIITNAHVIAGTDAVTVTTSDGEEYPAFLLGEDSQSDLAVLKIDAANLHPAELGDSSALQVGDQVAAIGNPLGSNFSGTMTHGIVSAIDRGVSVDGHTMSLIQTNTALNEGNSGGPLFNMYGQVVGVTNMKMVAQYSQATIEGIGFAIPTSTVKNVVQQLMTSGKVAGRPGLGITVGQIPPEAAAHYGLSDGLYISKVQPGSDADEKGITTGDILTAVNGTPVSLTDDVLAIKDRFQVGDTLTLTIWRAGETFDVDIVLMDMNALY